MAQNGYLDELIAYMYEIKEYTTMYITHIDGKMRLNMGKTGLNVIFSFLMFVIFFI